MLLPQIENYISKLDLNTITAERAQKLIPIKNFILANIDQHFPINMTFICTHNSRRSLMAQIWCQTIAYFYNIHQIVCYSGGTEVTEVNPSVIDTLRNTGFMVHTRTIDNQPLYNIRYSKETAPILGFSKIYQDTYNPFSNFIAVMTCSEAESGCPYVPGTQKIFSLNYEDPKIFDNTPLQAHKYNERSLQIATEMKFILSINN